MLAIYRTEPVSQIMMPVDDEIILGFVTLEVSKAK
jgi:hypothetical protein